MTDAADTGRRLALQDIGIGMARAQADAVLYRVPALHAITGPQRYAPAPPLLPAAPPSPAAAGAVQAAIPAQQRMGAPNTASPMQAVPISATLMPRLAPIPAPAVRRLSHPVAAPAPTAARSPALAFRPPLPAAPPRHVLVNASLNFAGSPHALVAPSPPARLAPAAAAAARAPIPPPPAPLQRAATAFAPLPTPGTAAPPAAADSGSYPSGASLPGQDAASAPIQAAPIPPAPSGGGDGGVLMIDGMVLGRWIMDHLTHQASLPPTGGTTVNARLTPLYPGAVSG